MSSTLSPSGVKTKAFAYELFEGIDAHRDATALDTGRHQHLTRLENGYCDWRGVITRDPGAIKRGANNAVIDHIAFFGRDLVTWAQRDGGGITLNSDRGHVVEEVYPLTAAVTSTVFNHRVHFMARGHTMYNYDGFVWRQNESPSNPQPAFGVAIQRRLAVAGFIGRQTAIDFSRVDDPNVFPDDEQPNNPNVLKAARLDIRNVLGTADEIKGLGVFESNRLAIFTSDRTIIYTIEEDYTRWSIDDRANIRVGTISHNTIAQAGGDLLFCSRDGVHALRRSDNNGVTIFTLPLSHKIDLLYRRLLRSVENPEAISAVYDQDKGQYHIFFPRPGGALATRLTVSLTPNDQGEPKWSTGTFLNARCGAHLAGQLLYGTSGGIYEIQNIETHTEVSPKMTIETPVLWQGALNDYKESHSIIIQASGKGVLTIEAFDERGRLLSSQVVEIQGDADDSFPDVPLNRQYERKFEHRYRGVQFRFTVEGSGVIRITGFAVLVRRS
jgi:hypothetical protein